MQTFQYMLGSNDRNEAERMLQAQNQESKDANDPLGNILFLLQQLREENQEIKSDLVSLSKTVIQHGQNVSLGKFNADIKDSDMISDDFDENLFACATALFNLLVENGRWKLASDVLAKEVGDTAVKPGISDDYYKRIIIELTSKCENSDLHDYRAIRVKFGLPEQIVKGVEF